MAKSLVIVESPAKAKTINKYLGRGLSREGLGGARHAICPRASSASTSRTTSSPSTRSSTARRRSSPSCRRRPKAGRHGLSWRPTPTARARRSPGTSPRSSAPVNDEHPPRPVQRDHQEARSPRRIEHPARARPEQVRRAAGAPHPRPAGRLQDQPAALGEGAPRAVGRARAVGGGAADRASASARSGPSCRRSTGRSTRDARGQRTRRRSRPGSSSVDGEKAEPKSRRDEAGAGRRPSSRGAALDRRQGRAQGAARATRRRRSSPRKLQQEAARKLGFTAKRTMALAQRLYEGVELGDEGPVGLITYMRTDSTRVSRRGARRGARATSRERYGDEYLPDEPRRLQDQEGRAGRPRGDPADLARVRRPRARRAAILEPERRAAALHADLEPLRRLPDGAGGLRPDRRSTSTRGRATSSAPPARSLKFAGFTRGLHRGRRGRDERDGRGRRGRRRLAAAARRRATTLQLLELDPEQHFTQPPPRFTEATLVKELEEKGIGRPSTYAAILSTIQRPRATSRRTRARFCPTELGILVTDLLVESLPRHPRRRVHRRDGGASSTRSRRARANWVEAAARASTSRSQATSSRPTTRCATSSARRRRPTSRARSAASRW